MGLWQALAATGAGVVGALVGALYLFQEMLVYHPSIPTREYEEKPNGYAMHYEDVSIITEDNVRLHAWLITRPQDSLSSPTFLYFHGNAGNIGHRLSDSRQWHNLGYNLLMVSYRGYGQSEGSPSERGLKLDAKAALEYAAGRSDVVDTGSLWVFGRSIGGAVALSLAVDSRVGSLVKGVVIENTFTSIDDLIDVLLPPLRLFKCLNRNRWNSLRIINKVKIPILFLSGLRDELVPPSHMRRLHEAASASTVKHMKTFADGTHNDTWYRGGLAYYGAIKNFVDKVKSG
eukprot:Plantae.Rhodophyta-Hildenbrandia_rubra.ctg18693.p1 GENE.Plantae.Rhodophyta-Hildenbrandia_rubra.ctg18693~~Plantae.Rhodophyta-Hildenbrandia_rubra.ctg18693.p1  ORF type:complete len:288 (+),score=34.23 Plantae.Rhodophyta-Hildenbrandia_rubra.ctg18693:475-1338(+)